MNLTAIVAEAAGNLRHRLPLSALALALAIAAMTCATATAAHRTVQLDASERAAGRDVLVATATSDAGLAMTSCVGLTNNPMITEAGGPFAATNPDVRTLDQSNQNVTVVTPGALRVWLGDDAPPGLALGQDLAEVLQTGSDGVLLFVDGVPKRVNAVVPGTVPLSALQSSLVIPELSAGPLAECWIAYHVGHQREAEALAAAAFAGTPVALGPFVEDREGALSGQRFWESFVSLHVWAIAGAVAAATLGATLLFRRKEASVYAISGFRHRSIAAIFAFEAMAPSVPATMIGSAWGIAAAVALARGPVESAALMVATTYAAAAWIVFSALAVGMALLATRVNPFHVLKDA